MKVILEVDHVEKYYGRGATRTKALDGIQFRVYEKEFVGIMGASGSGKTTLLNCISTITKPSAGRILLNDTDLSRLKGNELADYRGRHIGFIFQQFNLFEQLTGFENIMLPLGLQNVAVKKARPRIEALAEKLGVTHVLDKYPTQMSGGENQRVAACRAIVTDPQLVLADEPTGALDSHSSRELLNVLENIHQGGATILMVTHDPTAASYCRRILMIKDGKIFNELLREPEETRSHFYDRVVGLMTLVGGGSDQVL